MKAKKILSMFLAVCLVAAMTALPAAADSVTDGGSLTSTLTGTIKATQLTVTVPATVAFDVDPTVDGADNPQAQITPPTDDIKITNGSVVPIYAKISSVTVSDGVSLVSSTSGLTTSKAIMFGFKAEDCIKDYNTTADWLTVGEQSTTYLLSSDGKIDADGELTMEISGYTTTGWSAGDTFTVTPTIVVSANAFS